MPDDTNSDDRTRSFAVLSPGISVAHYTIVEKLGSGGMGDVYLADDTRLRRQVALKFLPTDVISDEELKARFLREARATAALSHANIITVHDIADYYGRPYIVMEYVSGQSLKGVIRERSLSSSEIVKYALQVAEALGSAHGAGIVHRDIKSDNIIIQQNGKAKLFDFGLAWTDRDANLTKAGTALGTIAYMSPEQAQGKTVDQRSDLFSLGIVLYEMISRRLPFTGDNMAAIINSVIGAEPPSLSEFMDEMPEGLDLIVSRLLAKNSADRYQNAAELAADLRLIDMKLAPLHSATRRSSRIRMILSLLAVIVAVAAGAIVFSQWFTGRSAGNDTSKKMLAVLPFQNLGPAEDAFFADGTADEIRIHLAKLSGVSVISRSSVMQYRDTDKPLRETGSELGIDYILEGTVRWSRLGDSARVRVSATLTDVEGNVSLWAESYDRVINDIFSVQSDIAQKVSEALNLTLLVSEQEAIKSRPTDNLEAYTYFLQGRDYFGRREWELAQQMFEKAITLDATFALSYANLSRTHSLIYWWYIDRTDGRLENARVAAQKALHLDPDLAEAHLAMGRYYYRGFLDYDRALEEYELALHSQSNNSDLIFAIGAVKRRQGKWEPAVEFFRQAIELDPRSRTKLWNLGQSYYLMRKFDSALSTSERLITISPDYPAAHAQKIRILVYGMGDLTTARSALDKALAVVEPMQIMDISTMLDIVGGRYESAIGRLVLARHSNFFANDSAVYHLLCGEAYLLGSLPIESQAHFDSARAILEEQIAQRPEEAAFRSMLGVAYAGIGKHDMAVQEGLKAIEIYPMSVDAMTGASWRHNLAIIYVMTGHLEEAITNLEYLMSVPSEVSVNYLNLYPIFEPLRTHPRLQSLLQDVSS